MLVLEKQISTNSFLCFANTNVKRKDFIANVTATDFRIADAKNEYAITGKAGLSYVDNNTTDKTGYLIDLQAGKISGNYQLEYNIQVISDKYDHNDLGYLRRGNEIINSLTLSYIKLKPFSEFVNLYNTLSIYYKRNYSPDIFTSFYVRYNGFSRLKNRMFVNFWASISPVEEHNLYETRVSGRKIIFGKGYSLGLRYETDPRKPLTLWLSGETYQTYDFNPAYKYYNFAISPGYKLSSRSEFSFTFEYDYA